MILKLWLSLPQDKGEPFRPQRASPPPPVMGQTKQEVVEFADVELRPKVHQVRMTCKFSFRATVLK